MRCRIAFFLLASLSACNPAPQQQAKLIEILTVACNVDGVMVPVAQPIVAALGTAGATVTSVDLLIHPAVVATCQALKGVPVSATPVATVNAGTVTTAASP
jgi:hypothetical protein